MNSCNQVAGRIDRQTASTASVIQTATRLEQGAWPPRRPMTGKAGIAAATVREAGARGPAITHPSETFPGTEESGFPDLPMSDRS